jgi:hypothetical protein
MSEGYKPGFIERICNRLGIMGVLILIGTLSLILSGSAWLVWLRIIKRWIWPHL